MYLLSGSGHKPLTRFYKYYSFLITYKTYIYRFYDDLFLMELELTIFENKKMTIYLKKKKDQRHTCISNYTFRQCELGGPCITPLKPHVKT